MKFLLFIFSMLIAQFAYTAQIITWEALRPAHQSHTYSALSSADQALISEIYLYTFTSQTRSLSPMEKNGLDQRVALAERRGLNVEELIKQRQKGEQVSNAIIEDLHYNEMKIAGFLVPLEMVGLVGTQFILVPTAGACIHPSSTSEPNRVG